MTPPDEQALALQFESLAGDTRRAQGAYFTPADIVSLTLELVAPYVPAPAVRVIDPACGAGAFLSAAAERWTEARLVGLELSADVARFCAERVPRAQVLCADALRGGLERVDCQGFVLFVGNPPYNGTSKLLRDKAEYRRLCALLPEPLPSGTSLRDDFAFFLLCAANALRGHEGAMAFITPASLLDSFMYAPLRKALTQWLSLCEVVELGGGIFEGAKVRTCITVWTTKPVAAARYRRLASRGPQTFVGELRFEPASPEFLLRPAGDEASALDAKWRAGGEELLDLVPISFPGLKTRFDELLVDDDPRRLYSRVRAFLTAESLPRFAEEHGLQGQLEKLSALRQFTGPDVRADEAKVRRFFRYKGSKHRGAIPASAHAYCYLDRRLIPRGDHRFRGDYDPHASALKLVFNTRELPLCAAITDVEGCVHAHRHTRFAPYYVPRRIRDEGLEVARPGAECGELVPNLSPAALHLGSPEKVFAAICRFINSAAVQNVWAPAFAATRDLPVPLFDLEKTP